MTPQLAQVVIRLLLFSTFAAASLAPPRQVDAVQGPLDRRQENTNNADEDASTTIATPSRQTGQRTSTPTVTNSGRTTSGRSTVSRSDSASGTRTTGDKASRTSGSKTPTITEFDPILPPGGISMIEPAATDPASYYKIGDHVTFRWNYTSLSMTPSAIDIMASCAANAELYTLAVNQTVEETGAITWDTGKFATGTAPLLTESYTLIIYDAGSSVSATPKAGYLGSVSQFVFAMYSPQQYTPLNEFKCATCNGALSNTERHALGFTFAMTAITLLSFTWFVGGVGALF